MKTTSSTYRFLKTHLRIFQLLGTFPLSLEEHNFLGVSPTRFAVSVVSSLFVIIPILTRWVEDFNLKYHMEPTSIIFNLLNPIFMILIPSSIYVHLRHRVLMKSTLTKLISIYDHLAIETSGIGISKVEVAFWVMWLTPTIIFYYVYVIFPSWSLARSIWQAATFYSLMFLVWESNQFSFLVLLAGKAFENLAGILREGKKNYELSKDKLANVLRGYDEIEEVCVNLMKVYELPVLEAMVLSFMGTLSISSYELKRIRFSNNYNYYLPWFEFVYWNSSFVAGIQTIIRSCQLTKDRVSTI